MSEIKDWHNRYLYSLAAVAGLLLFFGLTAVAKNPKLQSKLQNMPIPLSAETVDDYMGPVLEAAETGDFSRIKNMPK